MSDAEHTQCCMAVLNLFLAIIWSAVTYFRLVNRAAHIRKWQMAIFIIHICPNKRPPRTVSFHRGKYTKPMGFDGWCFQRGEYTKPMAFDGWFFHRGEYTKPMAFDGWFFKGGSTQNRWPLVGDFSMKYSYSHERTAHRNHSIPQNVSYLNRKLHRWGAVCIRKCRSSEIKLNVFSITWSVKWFH